MATKRTTWPELVAEPLAERGRVASDDEAPISEFREFVFRRRSEAGLSQGELASRMGTTPVGDATASLQPCRDRIGPSGQDSCFGSGGVI